MLCVVWGTESQTGRLLKLQKQYSTTPSKVLVTNYGDGGLQNGGGGGGGSHEVLPLRKGGGAQQVLAMLKGGGAQQVLG